MPGTEGARAARASGGEGWSRVLLGGPVPPRARERGQGFTKVIPAYPGIKVVAPQPADFDRVKGLNVATNLLQAKPKAVGIFAENDEMALGAIQALGARAGKDVFVVGFDGTADGMAAIKAGTMHASVAQQPEKLGRSAVEAALALIKKTKVEQTFNIPVVIETRETLFRIPMAHSRQAA